MCNFAIAYDIYIKAWLCDSTGVMLGKIDGTKVTVEISIDDMIKVDVKSIKIDDIGKIDIQFEGCHYGIKKARNRVPEFLAAIEEQKRTIIELAEAATLCELRKIFQQINAMFI